MRKILFKAKRVDNGEWVEGYFVKAKWYLDEKEIYVIIPTDVCFFPHCEISEWHEVDSKTICQYTDLKDRNGNKIFEGDVVKCQDVIGRIGWHKTHLAYTILANINGNMQYFYIEENLSSDIEVIGNIFDNPKLVEEV